jgi:O-antigen ligase
VLGLAFVVGFGLFLLGLTRSLDGLKLRALCPQLVALGVLVALIGIVQRPFFTGKIYGFWTPQAGELQFTAGGGPFGPFVNRNHFAGWMLMMVPLSIGHFCALASRGMRGVKPGWRARVVWFSSAQANQVLLFGFAPLLMAASVVLTQSRSGTLSLLVALAICAAGAVVRRQAGALQKAIALTAPLLIAIVGLSWVGTDAIEARLGEMTTDLDGRLPAWRDAWRVIADVPWTGTGLNTYGTAMLEYQTFRVDAMHFAEAHNDYLQILAEGGVMLAGPVLVLAGIVAREIWRRFRQGADDEYGYWLRVGAVSGLIAILLQEAVEFSLQMPGNAALFVVLCAIATRDPSAKPAPAGRAEAVLQGV